jgi:tetratricopeptide (TPR) repeat protein
MSSEPRYDPEILLAIASMDYQAGRFADALRGYSSVLQLRPDDPKVLYHLGMVEVQMQRIDVGVAHIKRAIALDPHRVEFQIGLAAAYGRAGSTQESLKTLGGAVALTPESAEAFGSLVQSSLEFVNRGERVAPAAAPALEAVPKKSFSVIVCSRNEEQGQRIRAAYEAAFAGCDFEIVQIYDARSLCDGYNRGFSRSGGDIVVFSHDDIEIASPDFANQLLRHLATNDVIGIAGTSRLIGPSWTSAGWPRTHGCIAHGHLDGSGFHFECYGPPSIEPIEAVDGVFIAANRKVCEAIRFDDATFDNFHFYDLDFSYRAFREGFRITVPWDILIVHQVRPDHPVNQGRYPKEWEKYVPIFLAKHGSHLKTASSRSNVRWPAIHFANRDDMIAFHRAMTFAQSAH